MSGMKYVVCKVCLIFFYILIYLLLMVIWMSIMFFIGSLNGVGKVVYLWLIVGSVVWCLKVVVFCV